MAARIHVKSQCILYFGKNELWWFKTQQLILGTGTAIWWVTELQCAQQYFFQDQTLVSSNDIEQTVNTYKLNSCNKA